MVVAFMEPLRVFNVKQTGSIQHRERFLFCGTTGHGGHFLTVCRANRLDSLQIHLKPWVYISKLLSLQVGRCVYVGVCVCVCQLCD